MHLSDGDASGSSSSGGTGGRPSHKGSGCACDASKDRPEHAPEQSLQGSEPAGATSADRGLCGRTGGQLAGSKAPVIVAAPYFYFVALKLCLATAAISPLSPVVTLLLLCYETELSSLNEYILPIPRI